MTAMPVEPMPPPADEYVLREPRSPAPPPHNGKAYWIKVSAQADGTFTVTNQRNMFTKTYPARLNIDSPTAPTSFFGHADRGPNRHADLLQ